MSKKSTAGQTAYYQADLKEAKAKMAQSKLEKETKKYSLMTNILLLVVLIIIFLVMKLKDSL